MSDVAKRMIDRNAHRAGAGISAVGLLVAFVVSWRPIAPVMAAVMAIGPAFGLRFSPLGAAYRALKRALRLRIPVEPEEEAPPRFAQAMGLAMMGLATLGFYGLQSDAFGWAWVLVMAAAQGLLGATGICLGCEMYLVGRRLGARGA